MIRLEDGAKKWALGIGGAACLIAAFLLVSAFHGNFADKGPAPVAPDEFAEDRGQGQASGREDGKWVVYVTGAVMSPGVYEVPAGSRVLDAVAGAGGFSSNADPEAINLAERIEDEAHIKVPRKGEAKAQGEASQAARPSGVQAGTSGAAARPAASSKQAGASARININRATADEMLALPGIGPKLSQAIVSYREQNGPFATPEGLMEVRGIGAKRFESLKDLVSVKD
ncbi:MAG: helix-hairpin-helix domain-containing protein [Synergistaceae bacterium]|jgi:competence protein ComEA|nr:helix-hairpin-helix domain-containing protein [Synergistaceae bacterium]